MADLRTDDLARRPVKALASDAAGTERLAG